MGSLSAAIENANAARERYKSCCEDVWREIEMAAPTISAELCALTGFDSDTLASWVCEPDQEGFSLADKIATGSGDQVVAALRRQAHGFVS